jgi:CO dehydrogenase maturation factor
VRSVVEQSAQGENEVCILDTEASPEHLSRGTARYADAMYAVIEPWFKSLETGRRMALLARDLGLARVGVIANKVRDDEELDAVEDFVRQHDLDLVGVVPYDRSLQDAERAKAAPLDHAPAAPAIAAIGELARRLVTR